MKRRHMQRTMARTGGLPEVKTESRPRRVRKLKKGTSNAARSETRRAAWLAAATEEFIEHGFVGASLRVIVRSGGGSSATLYQQFGDKEGLFLAAVSALCDEVLASFHILEASDRGPERELFEFGAAYLRHFTSRRVLTFYRMAVAESGRFPTVGKMLMERGPGLAVKMLTTYLERQSDLGTLSVKYPELAARQFIEMIKAGYHLGILLVQHDPPDEKEIRLSCRQAASIFCRGLGP